MQAWPCSRSWTVTAKPLPLSCRVEQIFHQAVQLLLRKNLAEVRRHHVGLEPWRDLVDAFIRHLRERYGVAEVRQWYFEVWNEPNLEYFWSGDAQDYLRLYDTAARAVVSSMLIALLPRDLGPGTSTSR